MIVELPENFTSQTMYELLENVIDNDLKPRDQEIKLNFGTLRFIEPVGVTILSNLIEWLHKRDIQVILTHPRNIPSSKWDPLKYLDDSQFFQRYLGKSLTENAYTRDTTIPLQLVAYSNSYQWLDLNLTSWLSRRLNISKESLRDIKMSFGEIFNNINDHAQENIGCIFAQHYPASNTVNIAISDFGVGIPNNIRKILPSLTDGEALFKAIEEGFSSKTTPRNLGVGLHTLITNVVENNGGSVHIRSGYGILDCINVNNELKINFTDESSFYPGTLLEVILRTDTIPEIEEEEEEFEW